MPAQMFKPNDRVHVTIDVGGVYDTYPGFFVAMDETGLVIRKGGYEAKNYRFFPRERIVMIELESTETVA